MEGGLLESRASLDCHYTLFLLIRIEMICIVFFAGCASFSFNMKHHHDQTPALTSLCWSLEWLHAPLLWLHLQHWCPPPDHAFLDQAVARTLLRLTLLATEGTRGRIMRPSKGARGARGANGLLGALAPGVSSSSSESSAQHNWM